MTWDKRFNDETVEVKTEVKMERVADLLCSAMEGGMSRHWATIEKYVWKKGTKRPEFPHVEAPFLDGCAVIIEDHYERKPGQKHGPLYRLDKKALLRGLQVMQKKYPRHYADWVRENDDAITGDVFLQCCLLGDIVYG